MQEIRIGVVGAGLMGADHIRRITDRITGGRVAAVIEPDAARAAAAAAVAGAETFSGIDEAVAADAVDAVLVATPGRFHEEVLIPALDAGLPVLCEKPLTPDSASARRVIDREMQLERPHIQVGFMRRFDAEYQEMRRMIAGKEAGELLMLRCVHRNPIVPDAYTQRMLINDSVVHEFDVTAWLADSPIVAVEVKFARRNSLSPSHLNEPILVLIELANGVLVDVEMNVSAQFGYQVGTQAVFESGLARIGEPSGIQRWRDGRFSVEDHASFATRFASAYDRQIQQWVDAVRSGALVDGPNAWDGYRVAVACEAGVEALESGVRIEVADLPCPDFYTTGSRQ